jgi:hypothetical protein
MLSEMKPYHLVTMVCGLLFIYVLLVYPLLVVEEKETHFNSANSVPLLQHSHSSLRASTTSTSTSTRAAVLTSENKNVLRKSKPSSSMSRNHKYPDYSSLVGWSSDFHISTVKDIKDQLAKFGVKLIDKSLSGHCHLTRTCQHDLRVLDQQNGLTLSRCPNKLRRRFFEAYRDDAELRTADFFLCTHASSMCELFMPFRRPIIVIASTRCDSTDGLTAACVMMCVFLMQRRLRM